MTEQSMLSVEFVAEQSVRLSSDDLYYGIRHDYISVESAIALASLKAGESNDEMLLELAELEATVDALPLRIVLEFDAPTHIADPRESARIWLFLLLKHTYLCREHLSDPLGVVERYYSEFDYPESVAPFVRYMPPADPSRVGTQALYENWDDYLSREHEYLRSGPTS